MGLTVDLFSSQVGFHTATATFTATIKPIMLSWFTNNFDVNTFTPSAKEMGFANYLGFTSLMVFLHTTIFICIDTFSFAQIGQLLLTILFSSIVNIILIMVCDSLFIRSQKDF